MEELIIKLFNKCLEPLIEKILSLEKTISNLSYGKQVMNVEEVAEYIGMSKSWVDKNMDELPMFYLGSRPKFNKEDIDKWRLSQSSTLKDRCSRVTIKNK